MEETLERKSIMVVVMVMMMMVMMTITLMTSMMVIREMRVACLGDGYFLKRLELLLFFLYIRIGFFTPL